MRTVHVSEASRPEEPPTPVRRGRPFADSDDSRSQPVAIINETAARRYFPGVDPIGRHVANSRDRIMREVVGIVSDVLLG